jgi:hypothetical protein
LPQSTQRVQRKVFSKEKILWDFCGRENEFLRSH